MRLVKEQGGGLQTNPRILKTALLTWHGWLHAPTFDAVISCHKLTNKMFGLPWSGSDMVCRISKRSWKVLKSPRIQLRSLKSTWFLYQLQFKVQSILQNLDLQITIWKNLTSCKNHQRAKPSMTKHSRKPLWRKLNPYNPYLAARRALHLKKKCIRVQILLTRNKSCRKLMCSSRPLSMKQIFDRHVNYVWPAEPIRHPICWQAWFLKSQSLFASVSFLPLPSPSFIFWLSFHFLHSQNQKSRSKNKRKRLLRAG